MSRNLGRILVRIFGDAATTRRRAAAIATLLAGVLAAAPALAQFTLKACPAGTPPGSGAGSYDFNAGEDTYDMLRCSISRCCTATYSNNANIKLKFFPATGTTFSHWSGACSGSGDCSLTMDSNKEVTANLIGTTTSTALNVSPSSSVYGQPVTFTGAVAPGEATGRLLFLANGIEFANGNLGSGDVIRSYDILEPGTHTITAMYDRSSFSYVPSTDTASLTVSKADVTVAVTSVPAVAAPGQTVKLKASLSVVAPGAETPYCMLNTFVDVIFKRGSTVLGTATWSEVEGEARTATLDVPNLDIGTHAITAEYSGNSCFKASSGSLNARVTPVVRAEARVNTVVAKAQLFPAVARLTNGYMVVWASNAQDGSAYGIFGQRYNFSGVKQGEELPVNSTGAGNQSSPKVAGLTKGGFVAVWQADAQDAGSAGIYAQRFTATGAKTKTEFKVNTRSPGAQTEPAIAALKDGGFVVAWTSDGQDGSGQGIYAQRYDAAARKAGTEFRVNTKTPGAQSAPAVSGLSGGGFVVAWQGADADGLGIFAQRYDSAGKAVGTELAVNKVTADDQSEPSVAGLSDGGFVVVWQSDQQDGAGLGVYARRFSSAGRAVGNDLLVNFTTAGDQSQPAVSAFADRGFVVAWTAQDASDKGVFAQVFTATAAKTSMQFQLNATATKDQWQPAIAANAGGQFMSVWTSRDQDRSLEGVYGALFGVAVP